MKHVWITAFVLLFTVITIVTAQTIDKMSGVSSKSKIEAVPTNTTRTYQMPNNMPYAMIVDAFIGVTILVITICFVACCILGTKQVAKGVAVGSLLLIVVGTIYVCFIATTSLWREQEPLVLRSKNAPRDLHHSVLPYLPLLLLLVLIIYRQHVYEYTLLLYIGAAENKNATIVAIIVILIASFATFSLMRDGWNEIIIEINKGQLSPAVIIL